jgi:hypothetical protein
MLPGKAPRLNIIIGLKCSFKVIWRYLGKGSFEEKSLFWWQISKNLGNPARLYATKFTVTIVLII